jgi:haloalkane dehalogenase
MNTPSWLDRAAWPYPPRFAALSGGRLHYVDEGHGPPVVLVHGTPTWSFEWRHVIAGLKDTHRVLAADHLGFGLSDRPSSASYTPEAHAARFAQFIGHVLPHGPLSLVVHDFGGPIALDWALDHPDRLAHLVIVNSWMWSFEDDALMKKRAALASGALGRFLYRYVNFSQRVIMPSAYGNKKALTREIHRQYLPLFPDANSRELVLFALAKALLGSSAFYQRLWDRRQNLARVPMTIVWGMRDSAFGPQFLDRWTATFPHARAVRMESAGHWPHEEQPQDVIAELRRLLP